MTIKTIKINKNRIFNPEQEREVKGLIITLALFASGMIIGAGMFRHNNSEINDFISIFNEYIILRANQKAYQIFINSLIINMICLTPVFLAGMSCIGFTTSVCIPVIKGFGFGLLSGYLFTEHALHGIGYYLIIILPGAIIANSLLLIACNNSCFMSADILATVLSKKQADATAIINYMKKNSIMLLLSMAASLIDCILVKAFSYLFSFYS